MITPGLVSVTFRSLSPEEIIRLVQRSRLEALEWGGDVHVPHGDLARARQVGRQTVEAGLRVCAYGSYYRAGASEGPDFEAVLSTALALGAPLVRVWAGRLGSREASPADWERVATDSRRICDLAAREGLAVAYEFHSGTLTDTNESARRLLQLVDHELRASAGRSALGCYWQPSRHLHLPHTYPPVRTLGRCGVQCRGVQVNSSRAYNIEGLEMVGPWLANLHVFQWIRAGRGRSPSVPAVDRRPLAEGEPDWLTYLRHVSADEKPRSALLEFVRGDLPEQFLEDAAVLKRWLTAL